MFVIIFNHACDKCLINFALRNWYICVLMVSSFRLVSYLHINLPPHFARMNLLQTRKVFITVIINSLNKSENPSPLVHNYSKSLSSSRRRPRLPWDPGQLFPKMCKLRVWFSEFLDSFGVSLLSLYPAGRAPATGDMGGPPPLRLLDTIVVSQGLYRDYINTIEHLIKSRSQISLMSFIISNY